MLDATEKFEAAFVMLQYPDAKYKKHFEKEKIKGPPEKEDWNTTRVFVKFLKMFYNVTLKFSGSLHITPNIFFKELVAMQRTLQKMANGRDKVIAFYACRMKENFAKYWENFSNVDYLLHVAIVMDPRYKMKYVKFCFEQVYEASEAVTKIALVESTFNRLYEWYYDIYSSELGNEMNTPTRL